MCGKYPRSFKTFGNRRANKPPVSIASFGSATSMRRASTSRPRGLWRSSPYLGDGWSIKHFPNFAPNFRNCSEHLSSREASAPYQLSFSLSVSRKTRFTSSSSAEEVPLTKRASPLRGSTGCPPASNAEDGGDSDGLLLSCDGFEDACDGAEECDGFEDFLIKDSIAGVDACDGVFDEEVFKTVAFLRAVAGVLKTVAGEQKSIAIPAVLSVGSWRTSCGAAKR